MLSKLACTSVIFSSAHALKRDNISPMSVDNHARVLTDASNRQVVLHGVNVVPKIAPYLPLTQDFDPQKSLNELDMDNLASWGMNFIRLGVMWEAVEVKPDVFDSAYLEKIETLINKLGEKGFYVLIDAH